MDTSMPNYPVTPLSFPLPSPPPGWDPSPEQDQDENPSLQKEKTTLSPENKDDKIRGLLEQIELDEKSKKIFDEVVEHIGVLYGKVLQCRKDKREYYRQIGREINTAKPQVSKKYRSELVPLIYLRTDVPKGTLNKARQFAKVDPGEASLIPACADHLSWRRICRILPKYKTPQAFAQLFVDHPDLADLEDPDFHAILDPAQQQKKEKEEQEKSVEQAEKDANTITTTPPPPDPKIRLVEPLVKLNEKIVQEEPPWKDRVRILPGRSEGAISLDMTLESYAEYTEVITYLAAQIAAQTVTVYEEVA